MDSLKLIGTLVLCIVAAFVPVSAQQAIHTTNADGSCVNCNIYANATDVYLNGGPLNCGGSTLADGDYYFQVTNTSVTGLLSTDPLALRRITFTGGLITAYTGPYLTGTGHCGGLTVPLAPFDPSANGVYKVGIIPVGSFATYANCDHADCFDPTKTDNFKVAPGNGGTVFSIISGTKFYDSNTNGVQDGAEPGIPGWRILKTPPLVPEITYTDSNGAYSFPESESGTYTISEVLPGGTWINTTPLFGNAIVPGGPLTVHFGNVCLGAGGGRTKGFWTNKNGQGLITSGDLALLTALNLRDGNGGDFNPTSKAQLKDWLQDANAVNMAYMLSAQLAAMRLNVLHGFVVGDAWVHSGVDPDGCPDIANPAGFVQISPLMRAANTALGADGYTPAGDEPNRSCQEFMKDALDDANNNQNFVQPGPGSCPFTTPY